MTEGERERYRLHGKLAAHRRRVDQARGIVAAHPAHALSTSWGKDSVAALALAVEVRPDLTVLNARYPHPAERFADMDRVRDAALALPAMRSVRYVEVDCPGEWEMYGRAGRAFAEPATRQEREAARWWKHELDTRMGAALKRAGATGVFLGLRREESRARMLNIAVRGMSYARKDGLAVALPVARMTGADIWAAHVARGLPYLRIYDIAPDRERARSGFVWSTGAVTNVIHRGIVDQWRAAYPDELAAWFDRWPELRAACNV